MNFYSSDEYLETIKNVFFDGHFATAEKVSCGEKVLRCLVVDDRRIVTNAAFLDYHEPLDDSTDTVSLRSLSYIKNIVHDIIPVEQWDDKNYDGINAAPFIDWSLFDSFEDYEVFLKKKSKRLLQDDRRRRRRLEDNFGNLAFEMNDERSDVLEFAVKWKSKQLIETGVGNYFDDPKSIEFFYELRKRKLLTASTLRADGRLLSTWLGFVHEKIWSGWIFTYDHDPELSKYSVGRQLLYSMIAESYSQGHRQFDFSIGNEPYKMMFATNVRLVGPLGTPPLGHRILKRSTKTVKQILKNHPEKVELLREFYRKTKTRFR